MSLPISPEDFEELEKAVTTANRILEKYKNPKAKVLPPSLSQELLTIAVAVHEKGDQISESDFDQLYKSVYNRKDTLGKGGIFKGDTFSALPDGKIAITKKGFELVEQYGDQVKKEANKLLGK